MDIFIPSRKVEVLAEADLVVCGAGCSGVAAAMALDKGQDLAQVDVSTLQTKLRADGAYIEDVPTT